MYEKVTLYLSKDGDSFELKIISNAEFRHAKETDDIHPILREAPSINSLESALTLLNKIKDDPSHQQWVNLYHMHNKNYNGHHLNIGFGMQKGAAHQGSIDKMISFVQTRISDLEQSNTSTMQCRIL